MRFRVLKAITEMKQKQPGSVRSKAVAGKDVVKNACFSDNLLQC